MSEVETITGKLKKFLYHNESGWAIALFKSTDNNAQVKIKGNIALLEPKGVYELTGKFQTHPKYGKNFDVESFKLVDFKTSEQYLNFFKEMIPGIGIVTAQKIIDVYQNSTDLFQDILDQPEKLNAIKGLGNISRILLLKEIKSLISENKLTTIFFNNDLKMDFLINLKNEFANMENKEELIEQILTTKFYEYGKTHLLTPFNEVDKVAMFFQKLEPTNLTRLAWNLNYLIEQILQQTGNTYTSKKTLLKHFQNSLGIFDEVLFEQALFEAIEMKLIYQQSTALFSDQSWNDELIISHEVLKKASAKSIHYSPILLTQLIGEVEIEIGEEMHLKKFSFDEQQKLVLTQFANQSFLLLNGGPGTGKTTVLKAMVKLYKKLVKTKPRIAIATPTGRAASRINELDENLHAKTIHKLLQANEDGRFSMNALNPLEEELIILDEASMIDNNLFASFLDATNLVKKMVIIGDENQLPSVGYGNVFANLLQIDVLAKVHLNQIHRQTTGNGIIDLAYQVLNQKINSVNDFNLPNITTMFNDEINLDDISAVFEQQVKENEIGNVQVITSFYKGNLGINLVNQKLQQVYQEKILNNNLVDAKNHCLIRKDQKFYVADKVMFLVNDTALSLSNGDVGYIQVLNTTDNKLDASVVEFNGEVKNLSSENFNSLTLSYGCSVHKTQGSEYDTVIFVIEKNMNEFFLTKNLIYTAITRAKKHLYLVGDVQTLIKAIHRESQIRKTGLVGRMNSLIKKEYNF